MKLTLLLTACVALVAAAPQCQDKSTTTVSAKSSVTTKTTSKVVSTTIKPTSTPASGTAKRCGGTGGKKCATGESCLGERELSDGLGGICVPKPGACANFLGDSCVKGDHCVEDPNENCPPDVEDCGQGRCLPAALVAQLGGTVKVLSPPFRCGGKSGKKCRDNLYEVCVGEGESNDGMGVCIGHPMVCGNSKGKKCPDQSYFRCITDPRDDSSGICMAAKWATQFGLKDKA
ncbi:hypothetical protein TWF730_002678 [Orbilia blumenaviensis]|uniref:Uncharacterized protein n=1 Tax=Orbilia blumenaviensis TaxID=1796055 RepID=A0AAV9U6J2_9PEZI